MEHAGCDCNSPTLHGECPTSHPFAVVRIKDQRPSLDITLLVDNMYYDTGCRREAAPPTYRWPTWTNPAGKKLDQNNEIDGHPHARKLDETTPVPTFYALHHLSTASQSSTPRGIC